MVRILLATAVLAAAYLGCLWIIRAGRRRPLGLALALALALLVCLEALIAWALSRVRAISPAPVATANLLLALAGALVAWRVPRARRVPRPSRNLLRPVPLAVLVLFAMVLTAALAYRPNNWDSMTYHLARVAHWIQNRSVAPYPAGDPRQVLYPPGAEFLVLALQVVSGSDRADSLVQLGAWAIVIAAASPLARCFGAHRRVARASTLLVAATPMALLQGSSTQNDLVATATAVAVVAASLPLLHPSRRSRAADLALLAAAVAAAWLVKPSALLVAGPLAAWAGGTWLATSIGKGRAFLPVGAVVVAAGLVLVGPTLASRGHPGRFDFLYGTRPEVIDRAVNAVRGALRQLTLPDRIGGALFSGPAIGCAQPQGPCLGYARRAHEDFAGNPLLAAVVVAALAAAALRWKRLTPRARLGAAAWVLGWLLFHAAFRDNVWIPRLELPAMMLAPLVLGAAPGRGWNAGVGRSAVALALMAAVGLGIGTAVHNERRPLQFERLRRGGLEEAYYAPDSPPGLADWHRQVLEELLRSGCQRLVTQISVNGFDYPITWRAMQRRIEVRPAAGSDDWGCALFVDGPPPSALARRWMATRVRGFYLAPVGNPEGG